MHVLPGTPSSLYKENATVTNTSKRYRLTTLTKSPWCGVGQPVAACDAQGAVIRRFPRGPAACGSHGSPRAIPENTRTRLAHFPFQRTLEQFDFSFQPSVDERLVRELATLTFVTDGANVIFLGPPGVGKTHLAVALGMKAIEAGFAVYFVRAHHLLEDLRQAQAEHRLDRRMRVYLSPKVLIIDEFGVYPYDRTAATALFALVSARYEKGASIILTSNKAFAEWGEVLGDAVVATAILDRLLHHSHVLNIRGESYRLREKRQAGLFGGVMPAKEVTPPATNTNNSSN